MSTVQVFQCDGPGCDLSKGPQYTGSPAVPPAGWWEVWHLGGSGKPNEKLHFHSLACLVAYGEQRQQREVSETSE